MVGIPTSNYLDPYPLAYPRLSAQTGIILRPSPTVLAAHASSTRYMQLLSLREQRLVAFDLGHLLSAGSSL